MPGDRKSFLLRIPPELYAAIRRWGRRRPALGQCSDRVPPGPGPQGRRPADPEGEREDSRRRRRGPLIAIGSLRVGRRSRRRFLRASKVTSCYTPRGAEDPMVSSGPAFVCLEASASGNISLLRERFLPQPSGLRQISRDARTLCWCFEDGGPRVPRGDKFTGPPGFRRLPWRSTPPTIAPTAPTWLTRPTASHELA